jgi:hypothetical protein
MNGKILLRANKVKRKKRIIKIIKLALLVLMLLLLVSYVVVGIVYGGGVFTIKMDRNLHYEKGIIIYDDPDYKVFRSELYAESIDALDNISHKWLPDDLHDYIGGSHNGDNYIAYTFYVENIGEYIADYWSEINIDYVIRDVDEVVRIRAYKNGEYITYAKIARNGEPEPYTVPFESDTLIVRERIEKFGPGDINKYTIVIWLEGNDPECTDNILGGEIKVSMNFNSEIIEK